MSESILKKEEKIALELRALYAKYGYLPYKMSKFEEYDLYASNKDFLTGDRVITFNDTDGKLLALKPDVTLSIVKNDVAAGDTRKVYYNENVYRISGETKQFKELMQVGLERIGEMGIYEVYEAVYLAAASLAQISQNFVLDISHLGVLSALMDEWIGIKRDPAFEKAAMECLAEKNAHGLMAVCEKYGVVKAGQEMLLAVVGAYGKMQAALAKIEPYCKGKAARPFARLQTLFSMLGKTEYAENIRLDFSVVNNRNYYDNILFKGFIEGVSESVLSGGRYDKLMERLGKKTGAIGFAVYLDLLEGFHEDKRLLDVDVMVLYDDETDAEAIVKAVQETVQSGKLVSAQKTPSGVRYQTLLDIRGCV